MPADLDKKLRSIEAVQNELNSYSDLLSEPVVVRQQPPRNRTKNGFPVGTLISLPSRIPHGGPKVARGFRAVLFFTGCPPDAIAYNSDKQANRTTIIGNMLSLGWPVLTKHTDRMFLLRKWLDEGLRKDRYAVANIHHGPLKCLGELLQKLLKEAEDLNQDEEFNQDTELAQLAREFTENHLKSELEEEMEKFAAFDWDLTEWKNGIKKAKRATSSRSRTNV
jgi:hypothetical protein